MCKPLLCNVAFLRYLGLSGFESEELDNYSYRQLNKLLTILSIASFTEHWISSQLPISLTSVSDPYSFFPDPDPDPEVEAGGQYGSGYGFGSNPDPGL